MTLCERRYGVFLDGSIGIGKYFSEIELLGKYYIFLQMFFRVSSPKGTTYGTLRIKLATSFKLYTLFII